MQPTKLHASWLQGTASSVGHGDGKNTLRILIICHDFPPLNSSAAHRPFSWARTWTDVGHEVHVLTTEKYLHDGRVDLQHDLEGITVHAVPYLRGMGPVQTGVTAERSPRAKKLEWVRHVTRRIRVGFGPFAQVQILFYRPLLKAGRRLMSTQQFDVIVSSSAPDVCPLVAKKLACEWGIPWVSDYRDVWFPEFAVNRFWLTTFLVDRLNRYLLRGPTAVSTVSEGLAEYLRPIYGRNVWVCYNGYLEIDQQELSHLPTRDGKQHVVYTGNFYPGKRDPTMFFDAIRELHDRVPDLGNKLQVDFYGPTEEWVQRLITDRGLQDIVFCHGNVPYSLSLVRQRTANLLLFVDWMDLRAKGVLTGKLFEYLASKRPILCIGNRKDSEAADLIVGCRVGRVATAVHEITRTLGDLLQGSLHISPDARKIDTFSRRVQAVLLLEHITAEISAPHAS